MKKFNVRNFLLIFQRFRKVEALCAHPNNSVYKRIDENRELLELLQRESPELLKRCFWIESWLQSQDEFLAELAHLLDTKNNFDNQYFTKLFPDLSIDQKGRISGFSTSTRPTKS